jgi:hypothetical protein
VLLVLLVRDVPGVCAVAGVLSVANTQLLPVPLLVLIFREVPGLSVVKGVPAVGEISSVLSFSSFPCCGWCHSCCCWRSAVADISADDIVIDVAGVPGIFSLF